jgi:uncharacterized membrane protein
MQNPKLIIFIVSLAGAMGGIYFTAIANPPEDFSNWIVLFAIFGIIVANLIFLVIYEIAKTSGAPENASEIV